MTRHLAANTPTLVSGLSPSKRRAFGLITAVVAVILTLAGMEVIARLYIRATGRNIENLKPITGPYQPGRVETHPFLPMVLTPNTHFNLQFEYQFRDGLIQWDYTTNNEGFRGDEVGHEKNENGFRIIALGGSATFGEGVNDDETWPAQLEKMLQEQHPEFEVEVLNFGIPTATSAHSMALLALRGVHYQPDLVIFYEGVNDIHCCLGYANFRTDYSHRLRDFNGPSPLFMVLPRPFYESYALTILNNIWNREFGNVTGFVDAIPQERTDDPLSGIEAPLSNIVSMKGIAEAHGATLIFSTYHWFDPSETERRYNDALRSLASAENICLVDQAALIPIGDVSIHLDAVHFTPLGNEMMARDYFNYIEAERLIP